MIEIITLFYLMTLIMLSLHSDIFIKYSSIVIFFGYSGGFVLSKLLDNPSIFISSFSQVSDDLVLMCILWHLIIVCVFIIAKIHLPTVCVARSDVRNLSGAALLLCTLVLLISPLIIILATRAMGLTSFSSFAELNAIRSDTAGLGIYIYPVTMVLPFMAQIGFIILKINDSLFAKHALILCLVTAMFGLLIGFRGPLIALLGQIIFLCVQLQFKMKTKTIISLGLLAIMLLSVGGAARYVAISSFVGAEFDFVYLVSSIFDSGITRFRGVEALNLILISQLDLPVGLFSQAREALLSFIPTQLIQKDISLSEKIATLYFKEPLQLSGVFKEIYSGVSYGLIGEGYVVNGSAGILKNSLILLLLYLIVVKIKCLKGINIRLLLIQKNIFGFLFLFIEAPQLGLNAMVSAIVVNMIIFEIFIMVTALLQKGSRNDRMLLR